jgi:hypothetical protein
MLCVNNNSSENDAEPYVPFSSILMRQVPATDGMDLFCLPAEFFSNKFLSTLPIGTAANSKEARKGKGYFQHCFSLPNVNLLSVLEMETIHEEINKASAPFLEKVSQWMKSVYNGDAPSDTAHFLDKEILPATAVILHVLSENKILTNVSLQQNNELQVDIYLGEIQHGSILDFYKEYKVVPEATLKALDAAMTKEAREKRVPFMAVRVKNHRVTGDLEEAQPKAEEPIVLPVKKSISLA